MQSGIVDTECKGSSSCTSVIICTEEISIVSEKDPTEGMTESEASEEMKETDLAVPLFGCEMFSG